MSAQILIENKGPAEVSVLFVDPVYNTEKNRVELKTGEGTVVSLNGGIYYIIKEKA